MARVCLRFLVAVGATVCLSRTAVADSVVYVDVQANGADDGTSWVDAFADLQDALAYAADYGGQVDEIWITRGTYAPAPPGGDRSISFQLLDGVDLYGGFVGTESDVDERDPDGEPTILTGDLNGDDSADSSSADENSYHVLMGLGDGNATCLLDGLTITAGYANGEDDDEFGAGLFLDQFHPSLNHCHFQGNHALGSGGAIHSVGSILVFVDSTFVGNVADHLGGALHFLGSLPSFTGCVFETNVAEGYGGAIYSVTSNPTFLDCRFLANTASSGGAIYSTTFSGLTLLNCTLNGNSATGNGGAVYLHDTNGSFTNCVFSGNEAGFGAGISHVELVNFQTTVANCTFGANVAANQGGAFSNLSGTMTVVNSVLWGNEPDSFTNDGMGASLTIEYSCVEGGAAGSGNINEDPLWTDPAGPDGIVGTADDDYRLGSQSPCIDAADNSSVPPDDFDLDGDSDLTEPIPLDANWEPRFVDDPETEDTGLGSPPIVDMGAQEFQIPPDTCPGDANNDGSVDPLDTGYVLARFGCSVDEDPACAMADQNADGAVDPLDVGFVLARFGECSNGG